MNRQYWLKLLAISALILSSCGGGGGGAVVPASSAPPTPPAPISRVSVDSTGAEAVGNSMNSTISSDGRYVAFASNSANLVAGDTNGLWDIFVHDTLTGSTSRASVDSAGIEAVGGNSMFPSISADGRYIAFESSATNLVAGDTNATMDVFVHDLQTGITSRASVDSAGIEAVGGVSTTASISAAGRYVAFQSMATNLVAGDANAAYDIFVHDMQTGTTSRISVDSAGTEANSHSSIPSISGDGRYVAFESLAGNLVAGDTNGSQDIFLHDIQTGATTRVNVDSAGIQTSGGASFGPSVNTDGRYVAFESLAFNLVAGDTNAARDIFVHDSQTGITSRVSVDSAGAEAVGGISSAASISADGRYVAYESYATNLVANDTNGLSDIFVHDTRTGIARRVSVDSAGTEALGGLSLDPSISADGRYVAFQSDATNLVVGDTNGTTDVFRAPNR